MNDDLTFIRVLLAVFSEHRSLTFLHVIYLTKNLMMMMMIETDSN